MGSNWTRRRFLVNSGRVAAGAAATGWGGSLLLEGEDPAPTDVAAGVSGAVTLEDLDPVALAAAMIRFDTSHNGEGGTTRPHAEWLAAKWQAAGVETEIIETPKAGNVHCFARIRGTGAAPAILFLGHSDVVTTEPGGWTLDPYAGVERDGFLYGRGAIDMKGANAACMVALLRHLSEGATFDRDIIFLSDCDEEGGPHPARWLAEQQWDKMDCGAVLTEGGWLLAQRDGTTPMLATLTLQDKVFALVGVTARGTPTHSSRPLPDSAVVRLNRAVGRLADYQPDITVTPLVRQHFEAVAEVTDDTGLARAIRLMLDADGQRERNRAGAVVLARSPYAALHNALLRPTLAFVIEKAGSRVNIIPGTAQCTVNVRFLPGGPSSAQIFDEMRAAIDDDGVEVAMMGVLPNETPEAATERVEKGIASQPAIIDTDLYRAWESAVAAVYPQARSTPTLFEAGTATGPWRSRGIPVYGVYPYVVDSATLVGMHGNDERVAVEALRRGTDLMYELFARFRV